VFSQARVGAVITEMGLVYREYQQEFGKQHAGNDNALRLYDKALETPQKDQTEQRQKPTKIVRRQHVHHSLSHSRSNQTENKHLPFSVGSGRKTKRARVQRCVQVFLRCKLWTKVSSGSIESEAEVQRDLFVSVWVDRDRESLRSSNVDEDTGGGIGGGGVKNGDSASANLRAADEHADDFVGWTGKSAFSPDACSEIPHVLFMYCTLPPSS